MLRSKRVISETEWRFEPNEDELEHLLIRPVNSFIHPVCVYRVSSLSHGERRSGIAREAGPLCIHAAKEETHERGPVGQCWKFDKGQTERRTSSRGWSPSPPAPLPAWIQDAVGNAEREVPEGRLGATLSGHGESIAASFCKPVCDLDHSG